MKRLFEHKGNGKFPGLPCVKKALEAIIKEAEEAGEFEKAEGYKERYKDLTHKDVELESLIQFPKGRILVCVVARHRGWLRYDLEVGVADMFDVINEYQIPVTLVDTKDDLRTLLADKVDIEPKLIYQEWNKKFGFILENATHIDGIHELLGGVQFSKIDYQEGAYDPEVLNSGTVIVDDISVGIENMMLYFRDDYKPEGPGDDEVVIVREPMVACKTKIVFTLNSKIVMPTWAVNVTAPDFDIAEPVIADDKKSGYIELTLKNKRYYPGERKVTGTVTINEVDFEFDKSFQHNPVDINSWSGSNDKNDEFTLQVGLRGNAKGTDMAITGNITYKYNDENGKPTTFTTEIIRHYGSGSTWYIKSKAPIFKTAESVRYEFIYDNTTVPDSSSYMDGSCSGLMHMPEGATGIIVIPISLKPTDIEYEYEAVVEVTFNDPARTPIKNGLYGSSTILLNGEVNNRGRIYEKETGYRLHFTQLSGVTIDQLTVTAKVTAYDYIGYPSAWFEHRYGYTGGEGVFITWDRMQYSRKRGNLKYITAEGVTNEQAIITKKGFKEGIWSTCSNPKRTSDGIGWYVDLDMHIVDYNRPKKEFSTITLDVDGTQYDLKEEFDYKPVDPGTYTVKFDETNSVIVWTFTTAEGGTPPADVIVERDYDYGDDGSLTSGWVRNKEVTGDNTYTFSLNANRWGDHTYYRVWFSNEKEPTSSYYLQTRFVHEDIK